MVDLFTMIPKPNSKNTKAPLGVYSKTTVVMPSSSLVGRDISFLVDGFTIKFTTWALDTITVHRPQR